MIDLGKTFSQSEPQEYNICFYLKVRNKIKNSFLSSNRLSSKSECDWWRARKTMFGATVRSQTHRPAPRTQIKSPVTLQ